MSSYQLEPANFDDYRDFLNHRFEALKSRRPARAVSLLGLAKRAGISKSHLQFLFKKKRHIVLDKFPPLAKALRLSKDEEYFVFLLFCKNVSRDQRVFDHFEEILSRIRHEYVLTETLAPTPSSPDHRFMYQDSLAMILHALTRLKGFKEDPEWILENLKVPGLTEEKVRTTLHALEGGGVLVRDASGRLTPKEFPF